MAPPFDPEARDKIVERVEEAWANGERPDVTAYLPADPGLREAVLPGLLHIDLERRLKAGDQVRVEHYLRPDRFPELAGRQDELISLIAWEYRQRRAASRAHIPLKEYHERFPELWPLLKPRLLATADLDYEGISHADPLPARFGQYRIQSKLGAGVMGTVYLAYDERLQRRVALKVPHRAVHGLPLLERFEREALAGGYAYHPNICPVFEAGKIDGVPYLTMPYIQGRPLTDHYRPPVPPPQAADLVRRLALALQEMHDHGVVHRDLKPGNILVLANGEPVIMDFGMAYRLLPEAARLTQPGTVMGTPAYMAPEQARGASEATGAPCDIYSLGVILYELLTGKLPFEGTRMEELLAQVLQGQPTPPSRWRPELEPALEEVCLKAIARQVEDRFPAMEDFAAALRTFLGRPAPPPSTPDGPPTVGEVLLDPRAADDLLPTLRKWGWEAGLGRLRAAAAEGVDEGQRARHQLLLGWLAGDLGRYAEAVQQFQALKSSPALGGWALTGLAFMALRERSYEEARSWLDRALAQAAAGDIALHATIAHAQGTLALREGKTGKALVELHAALELFGPLHFGTGRVLDTLGTVHAARNNFPAAVEFYTAALDLKRRCQDEPGVALTHGQLGRLFLDWGRLDHADEHFLRGLELDRRLGDRRGEAQLCNHRGQVLIQSGQPDRAAEVLEECIRLAGGCHRFVEGYGQKDLALAHLSRGRPAEAEQALDRAESRFGDPPFDEGLAHVRRVRGILRRAQGRRDEAVACLRASASFFQQRGEDAEAARSQLELAHTLRVTGAAQGLVAEALLAALDLAESSRRGHLVGQIERELREVAELDYLRRAARRYRFEDRSEQAWDLLPAKAEDATVLDTELRPESPAGEDPAVVLPVRNHLYADLRAVLEQQRVKVVQYQGDRFIGLVRGSDHARAAVAAALAVTRALAEFNRPRRVLGWPLWHARTGLGSGTVCLGGAGTFHQLDLTVTGPPVCVAAALQSEAEADLPCVSQATQQRLGGAFAFTPASPRTVYVKGLGAQRAWDVTGPRE